MFKNNSKHLIVQQLSIWQVFVKIVASASVSPDWSIDNLQKLMRNTKIIQYEIE